MPSPISPGEDTRKIYKVAELNRLIRVTLEDEIGVIWIEGEVSNLRRPSSGHMYFTLKDEGAQISAVLFRGNQIGLRFELRDGLKVRVHGAISVYEAAGQYQVVVRKVEEAGKGSLQEAFEALKKKLAAEGLFDESRKKALPLLPRHVGIVTSPTGAAIRDILQVLNRRFPNLHILLAPVKVQGEGAAQEIATAIDVLNERGGLDVMIVGRGGGSLEDLWCFNEEMVARAIARSTIPVISAVGHEIDFTISDFVADVRAPTPSAAAEIVVGQKDDFERGLARLAQRLVASLRQSALEARGRLVAAARSYVFQEPMNLVRQFAQRIDGVHVRMRHALVGGVGEHRRSLEGVGMRLTHGMELRTKSAAQEVQRLRAQLQALSPMAVLGRGFSITKTASGIIVRNATDVRDGDELRTQVARGEIVSKVTGKNQGGSDGGKTGR
ncbi:MAG TPA: exodeoxyribonuclease VII large subunit [Kiritimatiellia bacterium]|nr:exodeoxyribonuclease VII large subunit [Kiritimatiellia bacterium]